MISFLADFLYTGRNKVYRTSALPKPSNSRSLFVWRSVKVWITPLTLYIAVIFAAILQRFCCELRLLWSYRRWAHALGMSVENKSKFPCGPYWLPWGTPPEISANFWGSFIMRDFKSLRWTISGLYCGFIVILFYERSMWCHYWMAAVRVPKGTRLFLQQNQSVCITDNNCP